MGLDVRILILFLGVLDAISALCPPVCVCDIDDQGRKRTRCENGRVSIPGSFDINMLDADTKVLIVSGSRNQPNTFRLSAQMFQNMRLEEIHLSHSDMNAVPDRAFYHVSNTLKVLNLTNNNLMVLAENNFRNLSRLTHLHLDYNQIQSVHSAIFSFLVNLRVLTISNNLIRDVPQRFGLQLTKLEVLDMSNNPIGEVIIPGEVKSIPEQFFQDFPALRVLDLANTTLSVLPWTAMQRSNIHLEELDLSNNKFIALRPNEVALLRNLRKLSLKQNPIQMVEQRALMNLYLKHLDLSGLPPMILNPGVFVGARIESLDLSDMGLVDVSREVLLPISQELVALNVSGNRGLILRSRMFEFLPNLRDLRMARLGRTQLPVDMFQYPNKIEVLDLSENNFQIIEDGVLSSLGELQHIFLAKNRLTELPASLNLPKILEIDLFENRLSSFPGVLAGAFSAPSSTLQSLRLNNNPWVCDCGVSGLSSWMVSQFGNSGEQVICRGYGNFTCPVCAQPNEYRGVALNRLPLSLLEGCQQTEVVGRAGTANVDVIIAVVVCLIVLIIAILLLVLWYRNRLHSYRTYEEKRKDTDPYENDDAFGDEAIGVKPKSVVPPLQTAGNMKNQNSPLPKAESDV